MQDAVLQQRFAHADGRCHEQQEVDELADPGFRQLLCKQVLSKLISFGQIVRECLFMDGSFMCFIEHAGRIFAVIVELQRVIAPHFLIRTEEALEHCRCHVPAVVHMERFRLLGCRIHRVDAKDGEDAVQQRPAFGRVIVVLKSSRSWNACISAEGCPQ